ncbi:MAG TPA: EamA family transporter [Acetobacteraceae bacterium]
MPIAADGCRHRPGDDGRSPGAAALAVRRSAVAAQPMPGVAAWTTVVAAALFCTSLGYALYFRILATAGATNLLLVTLLMPVGAMMLGMAILGEQIDAQRSPEWC